MRTAITGFSPSFSGRLAAAARAAGLDPVCLTPGELPAAAQGLRMAVVCGGSGDGYRTALAAAEKGLHVLCEPPFCASLGEFEELRAAAAAHNRALGALQPWERCEAWRELDSLVTSGRLGRVTWAQAEIFTDGPAPSGGLLASSGWAAFARLLSLVRLPPLALSARLTPQPAKGAVPADAAAVAAVQFGGADGFVRLAAGAHASGERCTVAGDRGRAELSGAALTVELAGAGRATGKFSFGPAAAGLDGDCLAAELLDFRREAEGGLPAGSSLRNSRYCARLLKNAYYSCSLRSAAVPL